LGLIIFDQAFHHRPMGHLDSSRYRAGISVSQPQHPFDTLANTVAAVLDLLSSAFLTVVIHRADIILV